MIPIRHIRYPSVVECAGIALIHGGRVFLVRPYYDFIPQSLAIPKGHVEEGETGKSCALREFREETGIELSDECASKLEFLTCVKTHLRGNAMKRVTVYTTIGDGSERFVKSAISKSGAPENLYGEYVDFDMALEYITPYQKPIIEALKKREMSDFETFLGDRI